MTSGTQISPTSCRAGRAMLGWNRDALASNSNVSKRTIADFENEVRTPHANNLNAIQASLENMGIIFLDVPRDVSAVALDTGWRSNAGREVVVVSSEHTLGTSDEKKIDPWFNEQELAENLRLEKYIELSSKAKTASDLQQLYSETVKSEGFENLMLLTTRGANVDKLHWMDFPKGYSENYFDKEWDKIDPILACAHRARRPFLWNDAIKKCDLSKPQISMLNEWKELGVCSGITFPFHGPGGQLDVMSISRRTDEPVNEKHLNRLRFISTHTWTRLLELTENVLFPELESAVLTHREIEVLQWSKNGKSYYEIAEILGISRKTVEFHTRNAMEKLGASNKVSAVVIAIHRGLISL